jgi:3'-5' exoribonuclease
VALPARWTRSDLLPSTTYDVAELWRQLLGFVESFTNPDLKRLLTTMLADPGSRQAYREAPAAKQLHHAWLGGCWSTWSACSRWPTASRRITRCSTATCC